jgi:hypothetical protein
VKPKGKKVVTLLRGSIDIAPALFICLSILFVKIIVKTKKSNTFAIVFRKILALLVAFNIIGSVPGVTVFAHYCNGNLATLSVFSEEDPCNANLESSCCAPKSVTNEVKDCCKSAHLETQSCGLNKDGHKDCCDTKVVKGKAHKLSAYRPLSFLPKPDFTAVYTLLPRTLSLTSIHLEQSLIQHKPPVLPFQIQSAADVCVALCTFLI